MKRLLEWIEQFFQPNEDVIGIESLPVLIVLHERNRVMTGAEIWDDVEEYVDSTVHSGSIYTIIMKLRDKELIEQLDTSRYKISDEGRRVARVSMGKYEELREMFSNLKRPQGVAL